MATDIVLALSTVSDPGDAERIARALVGEQLAACVNIVPGLRSIYRWKGEISDEGELLLLMKTTRARLPELDVRLREIHPYDTPELIVLDIDAVEQRYREWVVDSVK